MIQQKEDSIDNTKKSSYDHCERTQLSNCDVTFAERTY